MNKQYYLQDKELENADYDFFQHKDLASNIARILRETPPPYNIAVIGKWGLGKSSLINLATGEARNHPEEYCYIRINAWKYEKEALSKVFLRQVIENLGDPKERTTQQEKAKNNFRDIIRLRPTEDEMSVRAPMKAFWKRYGRIFLIYLLISFGVYALYEKGVLALNEGMENGGFWKYWITVITGYLRNFASLIVLPALIAILDDIKENIKRSQARQVLQVPEMNVEDYEIELQREIQKKIENRDDFKIIIVLDDLDRLSIEKMVEALDAIKMFINFPNCIFIVPYDDSILKDALIAARVRKDGCVHGTLDSPISESEQFLDKLFQYKIHLSPLLDFDIKKYAEKLCHENLKDFFVEYCNEEKFIRVLNRILIYPEVKTPRQVKKIVNAFVSYLMLAIDRERNGKVSKGFASSDDGTNIIAKLSVLQADFSDFFDLLFKNEHAMEEILDAQNDSQKRMALSEEIQDVLGMNNFQGSEERNDYKDLVEDNSIRKFPSSARPLLNFLNYTRRFQTDDLLSYLYVAMDDIVRATGSKAQQEFLKAATSVNVDEAILQLQETPKLAMAAVEFINRKDDIYAVINMVACLSHLMDIEELIIEEDKKAIADAIAERAEEIVSVPDEIIPDQMEYEGLLICNKLTEKRNEFAKLLNLLLMLELGERNTIIHEISSYLDHISELSEATENLLHLYIQRLINARKIAMDELIDIRLKYELKNVLWIHDSFELLIDTIAADNQLSNKRNQELCAIFEMFAETEYNKTFLKLRPLYGKAFMSKTFLVLLKQQPDKNPLQLSATSSLVRAQVQGMDNNAADINMLLITCKYVVDEEWSGELDKYLQGQVGNEGMWNILEKYSEHNKFDMIPSTMEEVIADAFENRNDINTDCLVNIIGIGEETVNADILKHLQAVAAYDSKNGYEYIPKLLDAYEKVNPDSIHTLVSKNITNMKAYTATSDAINCYADYLVLAADGDVEAELDLINAFLDLIDTKLVKGQVLDACISSYWKLCDFVSDDRFQKAEPELYKAVSQENCEELFRLFSAKQRLYKKQSGLGLQSTHLQEVCFQAIKHTALKTQAVETLDSFFIWINDIPKLAVLVYEAGEENINRNLAYAALNKFISKKIDAENARADAVREICQILQELGNSFLNEFLEDRVETIRCAVQIVRSGPDSFSSDEVTVLTKWIVDVSAPEMSIRPLVSEMLMILLNKALTEQQYVILVEILESIPKEIVSRKKQQYLPIFIGVLTKTGSSELREQLILLAQKWKINRDVVAQAPASMSEELEQYLERKRGK